MWRWKREWVSAWVSTCGSRRCHVHDQDLETGSPRFCFVTLTYHLSVNFAAFFLLSLSLSHTHTHTHLFSLTHPDTLAPMIFGCSLDINLRTTGLSNLLFCFEVVSLSLSLSPFSIIFDRTTFNFRFKFYSFFADPFFRSYERCRHSHTWLSSNFRTNLLFVSNCQTLSSIM